MKRKPFLKSMLGVAVASALPMATPVFAEGDAIKIAEELMTAEGTVMITGTILWNLGLAISSHAAEKGYVYLASEPLADALVWSAGNPYAFRKRASTYMQAAMLAEVAAKTDAVKYATIAPNYAYGKDAVSAFKTALTALKPKWNSWRSNGPPSSRSTPTPRCKR